jgi:predicted nucleotidyltransferase
MPDSNLLLLEEAAARLNALLDEVVFVGGATLSLLITDPGAAPARATIDVDVIARIATYSEYNDFSERLRACGFVEDRRENAPVCRWVHGGLTLDAMPVEGILGFSNRWYRGALEAARQVALPSGRRIRAITAPYFLGSKIEAFRSRGEQDFYASHDLEDFVSVIDGRESICEEVASAPADLRGYLAVAAKELLEEARFRDALPGYLLPDPASQQRIGDVLRKLNAIYRRR